MDKKEIENKVKDIISEISGRGREKLTLGMRLAEDIGIDSLSAAEIMFAIKEKFGIDISQENTSNINTLGDIIENLYNKLSK